MAGTKGRSGRPPKSVAKKLLAGNPGKRTLNKNEPKYSDLTNIEPPEWFDDVATTIWKLICPELCRERVLTITDIHNLEIFCCSYSNWRNAQQKVSENGITIVDPNGKKYKNPAMTALNESARQIATFGSMLGLDPASRQRLTGDKPDKTNRFAEF